MLKILTKMLIILLNVILLLNIFAKSIYAVVEANKNHIYVEEKKEDEITNNKTENIRVPNIQPCEVPKHQKSIYIIPTSEKQANRKEENNEISNKKTTNSKEAEKKSENSKGANKKGAKNKDISNKIKNIRVSNSNVINNEKNNNNKGKDESNNSQSNKNRKEQNKLKNINETKKQIKKENEKENNQTPEIYIENNGVNVVNSGQDTENDISIRNIGNTNFEKLIWEYEVPTKYVKLKKFNTGTYNQNIRYNLFCKTNLSQDYRLIMEGIPSNENFEIDFEKEFTNDEYVIGIKAEFKEIDDRFCSNENPHFVSNVLQDIISESKFVSTAIVKGILTNHEITNKSKSETFAYKSLPKTGF